MHSGSPRLLLVLMACNLSLAPHHVCHRVRCGTAPHRPSSRGAKQQQCGVEGSGCCALKLNTRQHFGQFISFLVGNNHSNNKNQLQTTWQIFKCYIVTAPLYSATSTSTSTHPELQRAGAWRMTKRSTCCIQPVCQQIPEMYYKKCCV